MHDSASAKGPSGELGIGMVGAGFLAETRARCYGKLPGGGARLVAVTAARRERAEAYAARHRVGAVCSDLDELLARPDVHVVDLCVPNLLHRPFTERAAAAGKHVICTKPLAAYVGQDLGPDTDPASVGGRDPETMLEVALEDARRMVTACEDAGVRLLYGENWLHAPAVVRAAQLLERAGGTILEMCGWEAHSGSHSPYSRRWSHTGGGALLRLGAHPIGAMLHLKRGVVVQSVTAEVGDPTPLAGEGHLATGWEDVESWGTALIAFADGSRAVARGTDLLLGGMESKLEIHASNLHLVCNLSPCDMLRAYAPDGQVLGEEYLMEKSSTGAGWSTPMPDEDWTSGQLGMLAAFVRALREGTPVAGDGRLGLEVTRVVYAAYLSARRGTRVELGG